MTGLRRSSTMPFAAVMSPGFPLTPPSVLILIPSLVIFLSNSSLVDGRCSFEFAGLPLLTLEVYLGFTVGNNEPVDCDGGSGATLFPLGVAFDWVPDVNGCGESGATADDSPSGGDGETDVFGLRGKILLSSRDLLAGETGGETGGEPDDDCDDNLS